MDKYENKSQMVWCQVWELLAADGFPEMTLQDVVQKTGQTTDKVFRTLHLMHSKGYVEKLPGDLYRLSGYWPKLGYKFAELLVAERDRAQKRLKEFQE